MQCKETWENKGNVNLCTIRAVTVSVYLQPHGDGDVFKDWDAPGGLQVAQIHSSWTLVSSHPWDPHICWNILLFTTITNSLYVVPDS